MPNLQIPVLVKHMAIAIYREGKISAKSRKDKFQQCLEIAKSRCQQYGFTISSGPALSDPIGLTSKGRAREAKHLSEGRAKTVLFDTLYDNFDIDGSKAKQREEEEKKEKAEEKAVREENKAMFSKRDRL